MSEIKKYMIVKGEYTHGNKYDEYYCGKDYRGIPIFTKDKKSSSILVFSLEILDDGSVIPSHNKMIEDLISDLKGHFPDNRFSCRRLL